MLVLVLGDMNIPHRAADIPATFKKMLAKAKEDGKMQAVLCTGNLCTDEQVDFLKGLCSDIHIVQGDFDDFKKSRPEFEVIKLQNLKFGLIHGHQVVPAGDPLALAAWQRKLDCDILISGYTHKFKISEQDGKFFINPGSITGSPSATEESVTPSFVVMDITGSTVTNYIYQFEGDEMKVKKKEFTVPNKE